MGVRPSTLLQDLRGQEYGYLARGTKFVNTRLSVITRTQMGVGATAAPYLAVVGILSLLIGVIMYAMHPHSRRRTGGSISILGQKGSFSGPEHFVLIGLGIFLLAAAAVASAY